MQRLKLNHVSKRGHWPPAAPYAEICYPYAVILGSNHKIHVVEIMAKLAKIMAEINKTVFSPMLSKCSNVLARTLWLPNKNNIFSQDLDKECIYKFFVKQVPDSPTRAWFLGAANSLSDDLERGKPAGWASGPGQSFLLNLLWSAACIIWSQANKKVSIGTVMACCLTTPSHYPKQCWIFVSEVLWHLHKSNFTVSVQSTILYNEFQNHTFKIITTSPRGQWVKCCIIRYWITVIRSPLVFVGQGFQVPSHSDREPYSPSGSLLQDQENPATQLEIVSITQGMSHWWPLLGLLSWCPIV